MSFLEFLRVFVSCEHFSCLNGFSFTGLFIFIFNRFENKMTGLEKQNCSFRSRSKGLGSRSKRFGKRSKKYYQFIRKTF